jgi:hypothetical protein
LDLRLRRIPEARFEPFGDQGIEQGEHVLLLYGGLRRWISYEQAGRQFTLADQDCRVRRIWFHPLAELNDPLAGARRKTV